MLNLRRFVVILAIYPTALAAGGGGGIGCAGRLENGQGGKQ